MDSDELEAEAVEYIQSRLSYDPDSGVLRWLVTKGPNAPKGAIAGTVNKAGRRYINLNGMVWQATRLIWVLVFGRFPVGDIDHINGTPGDDRLANLRECTHQQNMWNQARSCNNRSGFRGVSWHKQGRKWCARIRTPGTYRHLGLFATAEAAHEAYEAAARELRGEFHRAAPDRLSVRRSPADHV